MRILTPSKRVFLTLPMLFLAYNIHAQDQNLTLNQDPKFEQLLNDKRKINTSISTNDTYKIQIFSGKSEDAKRHWRILKENTQPLTERLFLTHLTTK